MAQDTKTQAEKTKWHSAKEVICELRTSPECYRKFQELSEEWQEAFLDFCLGKRTLPLLYDSFFKVLFHPDIHADRLSDMLSSFIGQTVKVKGILPNEDSLMTGGSLLSMDILVELEDGSLANVEVQKIPYLFPGERMSCYSADLLLRQYSRVRGKRGKKFKYSDVHKVYTIVIYEKTTELFHEKSEQFIHYGKTVFDTGLNLELLQEYWLIALDVFRKSAYTKDKTRKNGWLSLLSTKTIEEAEENCRCYPWLEEIYQEISEYRTNPKEVLGMYSEALRILDRNTVQYMIDEQKKEIEEQRKEILDNQKELEESQKELEATQKELEDNKKEMLENWKELEESQKELEESQKELEESQKELEESQKELEERGRLLEEQKAEIARLKALLEQKK